MSFGFFRRLAEFFGIQPQPPSPLSSTSFPPDCTSSPSRSSSSSSSSPVHRRRRRPRSRSNPIDSCILPKDGENKSEVVDLMVVCRHHFDVVLKMIKNQINYSAMKGDTKDSRNWKWIYEELEKTVNTTLTIWMIANTRHAAILQTLQDIERNSFPVSATDFKEIMDMIRKKFRSKGSLVDTLAKELESQ